MQIKRHWLLVETMPFEYFFSGVGVFASGDARIPACCRRVYLPTAGTCGTVRLWLAYSPEAALHQNANLKARRSLIYGPYTIMVCFEVLP